MEGRNSWARYQWERVLTLKMSERLAGEAVRICVPKQMPALETRTVGGP